MGAAYCSYKGTHITADILQAMTKSFKLKGICTCRYWPSLVISVVFTYWCTDMIVYAWEKRQRQRLENTAIRAVPGRLLFDDTYVYIYSQGLCKDLSPPSRADDSEMKCGRCPDIEENPRMDREEK
jgi:hypothetical protein